MFSIGAKEQERKSRRGHLMHDARYSSEARAAFKGQVYTAPMNWMALLEQLELMEQDTSYRVVPLVGQALAAQVRVCIKAGFVYRNKHLQ